MSRPFFSPPDPSEYVPYYGRYTSLVTESDILAAMGQQIRKTQALLQGLSEEKGDYRYAPGKWSVKELVGHVLDCERIFAYRALRFARNDRTPLPGFEQDDYVANASFDLYSLQDLAAEFEQVRQTNISFFRHLQDTAWLRPGLANGNEISVRALAFIIVGHERHHMNILQTRYLAT